MQVGGFYLSVGANASVCLGYHMGSKPGSRETDTGGGSNAVKEVENTQICLVPSAYSLG